MLSLGDCGFRRQLYASNKDKSTLSATQILTKNPSFWQYNVYADIRGVLWKAGVKRHFALAQMILLALCNKPVLFSVIFLRLVRLWTAVV